MAVTVYKYQDVIADPATGRPINGAAVTVKLAGTATLATLYDSTGTTPQSNPVYTDSMGLFSFFVAPGNFDLDCSFGSNEASRTSVYIGAAFTISGDGSTGATITLSDAGSGPVTVNLPSSGEVIIKKTDNTSNIVTISATGGKTVEGQASIELVDPGGTVRLFLSGTNWEII